MKRMNKMKGDKIKARKGICKKCYDKGILSEMKIRDSSNRPAIEILKCEICGWRTSRIKRDEK